VVDIGRSLLLMSTPQRHKTKREADCNSDSQTSYDVIFRSSNGCAEAQANRNHIVRVHWYSVAHQSRLSSFRTSARGRVLPGGLPLSPIAAANGSTWWLAAISPSG
jgi:hypothetical protein